jgi:TetR/AcrR family transcriptional regulator
MNRAEKGSRRKEEIVEIATVLFAERGYAGASMADLAEAVGLRKASLFHHFPSKDLLYAAVLEKPLRDVAGAIARATTAEGDFVARLDALSDSLIDVLGAQPHSARLLVREAMQWNSETAGPVPDAVAAALEAGSVFLATGVSAPPPVLKQLVVSIVGMHFIPFAVAGVFERFLGQKAFGEAFLTARKEAMRAHMRAMVLALPRVS